MFVLLKALGIESDAEAVLMVGNDKDFQVRFACLLLLVLSSLSFSSIRPLSTARKCERNVRVLVLAAHSSIQFTSSSVLEPPLVLVRVPVQSALWPSVEEAHAKKVHTQDEAVKYLATRLSPNQCRVDDPLRTQYFVQRKQKEDTTRDVLHRLLIPHIAVRALLCTLLCTRAAVFCFVFFCFLSHWYLSSQL